MAKEQDYPAIDFLRHLYARLPKMGVIELRAIPNRRDSGLKPRRRFTNKPGDIIDFIDTYGGRGTQYGVYYGVAKRLGKTGEDAGTKNDILAAPAAWVDVDTVKNGWDTAATAKLIHECDLRPSACVMSGGGLHLYWYLNEPCAEEIDIEDTNRNLQGVFAGDNVRDITRVLRLPGTFNTKRKAAKVEVLWNYHWQTHSLEELNDGAGLHRYAIGDKGTFEKRGKVDMRIAPKDDLDPLASYQRALDAGNRNVTGNLDEMWRNRVRYQAPRGYMGVHEAKLLTTAKLHCAGYTEKEENEVVKIVNRYVRQRMEIDDPSGFHQWDASAEEEDTRKMFRSWLPKWNDLKREHRKAKKEAKRGVG